MQETEYPDILSSQVGKEGAYETKPGIQFAAYIIPQVGKAGERFLLRLILQNALDVPIEGKVHVDVPTTRFFKSTLLSSPSDVPFLLDAIEVICIDIPIQSQLETPEADYEIKVQVEGKSIGKGNRIRERKEGKEWGKAIGKSVLTSTLLLPFGGVAIYTPSDTMKGKLSVSGRAESVNGTTTQPMITILFGRDDVALYQASHKWLSQFVEDAKIVKNTEILLPSIGKSLMNVAKELFQEKQVTLSDEEALWIARYMAFVYLFYLLDSDINGIALDIAKRMKNGLISMQNLSSDVLSIYNIALKPHISNFTGKRKILLLAISTGLASSKIYEVIKKKEVSPVEFAELTQRIWDENDKSRVRNIIHFSLLYYPISQVETLFPQKDDALEHLKALKETLQSYSEPHDYLNRVIKTIDYMMKRGMSTD